jgi:hypothetical protein
MALASDLITADMVMAQEFPELSNRFHVMAVPRTVINDGASAFDGMAPEKKFLQEILKIV